MIRSSVHSIPSYTFTALRYQPEIMGKHMPTFSGWYSRTVNPTHFRQLKNPHFNPPGQISCKKDLITVISGATIYLYTLNLYIIYLHYHEVKDMFHNACVYNVCYRYCRESRIIVVVSCNVYVLLCVWGVYTYVAVCRLMYRNSENFCC